MIITSQLESMYANAKIVPTCCVTSSLCTGFNGTYSSYDRIIEATYPFPKYVRTYLGMERRERALEKTE